MKKEVDALLLLEDIDHIIHLKNYVEYEEDEHLFQLYLIMDLAKETLSD